MSKILVTGANSQLALSLKDMSKLYEELSFMFLTREQLDITNEDSLVGIFKNNDFHYCINCAAYTNVEQAEDFSDLAFKINAEAVKKIAAICKKEKVILIHISTDYVFDGKKKTPYIEIDKTNPINEYGKSKLKGEHYISERLKEYYIIRTSWLYSPYGKNFVKTIINKIKENADLKVTIAEKGTPTSCVDLSKVIFHIITTEEISFGTYHYSNEGEATWYDFAKEIAIYLEDYDINKISQVPFFDTKANRPKYSVLSKGKLFRSTKTENNHWKDSLEEVVKALMNR